MVFFEYWHKEPGIAGELCDLLEASGQVVPEDLRRIAQEVEAGAVGGWGLGLGDGGWGMGAWGLGGWGLDEMAAVHGTSNIDWRL